MRINFRPKGPKPKCHQMFIEVPTDYLYQEKKPAKKADTKKKKDSFGGEEINESNMIEGEAEGSKKTTKKKTTTTTTAKQKKNSKKPTSNLYLGDPSQPLPDIDFNFTVTTTTTDNIELPDLQMNFDESSNDNNILRDSFLIKTNDSNKKSISNLNTDCKKKTNTSATSTTQLKLFSDLNVLNIKNNSNQINSNAENNMNFNLVPEPPKKIKKLLKFFTNNNEYEATEAEVHDCLKNWQMDEDDFFMAKNETTNFNNHNLSGGPNNSPKLNNNNNNQKLLNNSLNESLIIREKFTNIFQKLVQDLTDLDLETTTNINNSSGFKAEEKSLEPDEELDLLPDLSVGFSLNLNNNQINTNRPQKMNRSDGRMLIVNDTVLEESPIIVRQPSTQTKTTNKTSELNLLNQLFCNDDDEDDEDDDDLKFMDKLPLIENKNILNNTNYRPKTQIFINDTLEKSSEYLHGNSLLDSAKINQNKSTTININNKLINNLIKNENEQQQNIQQHTYDSTSTPVRSILKKTNSINNKSGDNSTNLINYSPLESPCINENHYRNQTPKSLCNSSKKNVSFDMKSVEKKPLNTTTNHVNESVIGITQALNLINSTCSTPAVINNKKIQSPMSFKKNGDFLITFDMKSNLFDLFGHDDHSESFNRSKLSSNSILKIAKNQKNDMSLELMNNDHSMNNSVNNSSRRLHFDEPSIMETSAVNGNKNTVKISNNTININDETADSIEDSFRLINKKKVRKT